MTVAFAMTGSITFPLVTQSYTPPLSGITELMVRKLMTVMLSSSLISVTSGLSIVYNICGFRASNEVNIQLILSGSVAFMLLTPVQLSASLSPA